MTRIVPVQAYGKRLMQPFDGADREECPICMDNDQFTFKSWVKLTNCSHIFHQHCIDLWLEHKQTCPVCVQNAYHVTVDISVEERIPVREYALTTCVCACPDMLRCVCCILLLTAVIGMGVIIAVFRR